MPCAIPPSHPVSCRLSRLFSGPPLCIYFSYPTRAKISAQLVLVSDSSYSDCSGQIPTLYVLSFFTCTPSHLPTPTSPSMSHYSDHNKRKRLSAAAPDGSDIALGGSGGASPRSTDDQYDDYYRSPASAITQSTGGERGGGRFSDAASYHSHHSQRSFASHGSHPSHSHSHRPAGRGQHAPHNYRGFSGGPPDVGDGNSTIATINSADLVSLKRDREREGRCSECGAQTHELRVDPRTGARTKEPLNVEGEVRRGRCVRDWEFLVHALIVIMNIKCPCICNMHLNANMVYFVPLKPNKDFVL